MIDKKLIRQLKAIDWDFPSTHSGGSKSPHWYPGTFPSQIPSALIQALSNVDDLVLDPYCGIGTTASEAIRLGRRAWVVDMNPIGIMSSYVYSGILLLKSENCGLLDLFFKSIQELINKSKDDGFDFGEDIYDHSFTKIDDRLEELMSPGPKEFYSSLFKRDDANTEDLEKWIQKDTLNDLVDVRRTITEEITGYFAKTFLTSITSSSLRSFSSQNKSWGHIADNVYPKEMIKKDVSPIILRNISLLRNNIKKTDSYSPNQQFSNVRYGCSLINWSDIDCREEEIPYADLLITSPPYGDAIDYILSQKLSLYFLGYTNEEISNLCKKEIGARRKRFKSNSRELWANQISEAALKQASRVRDGCIVKILPHKNHGREVGLNRIIEQLETAGWEQIFNIDRSISQKKTRQSWTSIKMETISIFYRK